MACPRVSASGKKKGKKGLVGSAEQGGGAQTSPPTLFRNVRTRDDGGPGINVSEVSRKEKKEEIRTTREQRRRGSVLSGNAATHPLTSLPDKKERRRNGAAEATTGLTAGASVEDRRAALRRLWERGTKKLIMDDAYQKETVAARQPKKGQQTGQRHPPRPSVQ